VRNIGKVCWIIGCKGIYWAERKGVTEEWWRLHNEKFYDVNPQQILHRRSNQENEIVGASGKHGREESFIQDFDMEPCGRNVG
jgi:hypothetical protein